jgi:hypothetical protein
VRDTSVARVFYEGTLGLAVAESVQKPGHPGSRPLARPETGKAREALPRPAARNAKNAPVIGYIFG